MGEPKPLSEDEIAEIKARFSSPTKPTIHELEELLKSELDAPVTINPDGSIGVNPNNETQRLLATIEAERAASKRMRDCLVALIGAAEADLKLNQHEEGGGYWSLATEAAISLARAALHPTKSESSSGEKCQRFPNGDCHYDQCPADHNHSLRPVRKCLLGLGEK